MPPDTFTKRRAAAPEGYFDVEAAGLRWLGDAGGVRVPAVVEVAEDRIVLERVAVVAPSQETAAAFGRALAATHRAGATHHGAPPDGWTGDGYIATLPLPHRVASNGWPEFYAGARLAPYLRLARDRGAIDAAGALRVETAMNALVDGSLGLPSADPARLHGDLWSGNVLWSAEGAVVIDPAAHGGNRETDLAMLDLFGLPHLDRVLSAYDEVWPLDDGWPDRIALHQLHPLLVHAALFGGGYGARAVAAAEPYS